jgi:TolA-binding protein
MKSSQLLAATPLVMATLVSGCFATQSDIRVLQGDISLVRTEAAAADSARRQQMDRILASLYTVSVINDSVNAISSRLTRFRSDMSTSMASVDQQLLAIQELTGQSQRRIQEVRASLEERQGAPAPAEPAPGTRPADPDGAAPTPGPNQLFQIAREQMIQGSNEAARMAFEDLLAKYPKADVADDAQFYIAETFAAEGNAPAADSVYSYVATKYAGSPRAATALYRRAGAAQKAGNNARAKTLFDELIKKYPRSDEASLARDRVKQLAK